MQLDGFGQAVETQTVFRQFDLGQQTAFKFLELHGVDLALEDRLLHPLPDAFAYPRDTPQASAPCLGFRGYVIADDDEHGYLGVNGT